MQALSEKIPIKDWPQHLALGELCKKEEKENPTNSPGARVTRPCAALEEALASSRLSIGGIWPDSVSIPGASLDWCLVFRDSSKVSSKTD